MKTNKLFGLAVLACGFALSFTSCTNDDNPAGGKRVAKISFENKSLNDLGFWCGEVNDKGFNNGYGTSYACTYQEQGVTFNTTYSVSYWSGFAISNRTKKDFTSGDLTPKGMPDQFNNVTGKARTGQNYCVIQTYGESIDLGGEVTVNGFWFTNSSYAANAYLKGDGMTPGKFEKDDWFKCIITGTKADGKTAKAEVYLAKDGTYVQDWQFCDLSSLGKVKSLSFAFDGTKKNDWGVTTPAYICIDDLQITE